MTPRDWCILRCAGRSTLALVDHLQRRGVEAWTPVETLLRPAQGKGRSIGERTVPLLPTFAFAAADRLGEIVAMAADPRRQVDFSVFHYRDRIPLIADRDLEPLRTEEKRAMPKARQRHFKAGEVVRVPEGSFAGMSGVVEQSNGRYTLVCFGGVRVKIGTFLLRENGAYDGPIAA